MKTHEFTKSIIKFLIKIFSVIFLILLICLYFNPMMIKAWPILGFLAVYLFLIFLFVFIRLLLVNKVLVIIAIILLVLMKYFLISVIFSAFSHSPAYQQISFPIVIIFLYFIVLIKLSQLLIKKWIK